jgi:hypothetical protein
LHKPSQRSKHLPLKLQDKVPSMPLWQLRWEAGLQEVHPHRVPHLRKHLHLEQLLILQGGLR